MKTNLQAALVLIVALASVGEEIHRVPLNQWRVAKTVLEPFTKPSKPGYTNKSAELVSLTTTNRLRVKIGSEVRMADGMHHVVDIQKYSVLLESLASSNRIVIQPLSLEESKAVKR